MKYNDQKLQEQIWQQVAAQLELGPTLTAVWGLAAERLGARSSQIWMLDREHSQWQALNSPPRAPQPSTLPAWPNRETLDQLDRWCRHSALLEPETLPRKLRAHLPTAVTNAAPQHHIGFWRIGTPGRLLAWIVFSRPSASSWTDADRRLCDCLRSAWDTASEHHLKLTQLERTCQLVEAEKQLLLRRLGRNDDGDTVIGEATGLAQVMERARAVCRTDAPVLILGETGTGKEVIARAIHQQSDRQAGPFIRVNCGAIPPELIDSQLFGHEKGSFTGADKTQLGWFERASGGTLFLDEIGELPLEAQVRFLRVLQDGIVERIGAAQPTHVDVRIVAATHQDLGNFVLAKKFREDLWYRLAVFPIVIPPLRERKQDITALTVHFAQKASRRFGIPYCAPTLDNIRALSAYHWPGNIRELGAVIDRATLLGKGKTLEIAAALGLSQPLSNNQANELNAPSELATAPTSTGNPQDTQRGGSDSDALDTVIKNHIQSVLRRTAGRIEGPYGAAKILQINPDTLRSKMRKLNIPRLPADAPTDRP